MPLKMTIEPQEWLMVGDTKVVNIHENTATFFVEGPGPILRQAHTIAISEANTSAKRVYLAVQRLYLGITTEMTEYHNAAREMLTDRPCSKEAVLKANVLMAKGSLYGALREYRKLID